MRCVNIQLSVAGMRRIEVEDSIVRNRRCTGKRREEDVHSSRNPWKGECLRQRRRRWCSGEEVHWIDGVASCRVHASPSHAHVPRSRLLTYPSMRAVVQPLSSHVSRSMQLCALCSVLGVLTLPPSARSHIRIRGPHDGDAGARAAAEGRRAATFAYALL